MPAGEKMAAERLLIQSTEKCPTRGTLSGRSYRDVTTGFKNEACLEWAPFEFRIIRNNATKNVRMTKRDRRLIEQNIIQTAAKYAL